MTVKPTEQIAKYASTPESGLFARLCGLLRIGRSGALSRRRLLAGLSTLCVLAGGLLFAGAPAYAFRTFGVSSTFGSEGSGDGQFKGPQGVALNESTELLSDPEAGDVYVADTGNSRVQWFALSPATKKYEYAGQFNGEQTPAKSLNVIGGITIDNSTEPLDPSIGDVYVASDSGGEPAVVDKFSAAGVYQGQLTGTCENAGETAVEPGACPGSASKEIIPFFAKDLQGVAVDPEGHLFVFAAQSTAFGAEEGRIDEFSSDGTFLGTFTFRADRTAGMAVDSSDNIYALTEGESGAPYVGKFDSTTGATIGELGDERGGGARVTAFAVDPANNHVYVDSGNVIDEYGPFGEPYTEPLLGFPSGDRSSELAGSSGVAVDTAGTVFATQSSADDVELFNEIFPPTVVGGPVLEKTAKTATLSGAVNPEGRPLTSCKFEYGTSTAYGHVAECEPDAAEIGGRSESEPVHAKIGGLTYDTTYHYRLIAGSATSSSETSDQEFTTSGPRISGEGASIVTSTFAQLQAKIDPDESVTTYHFEYDTSPYTTSAPHGTSLPAPSAGIGSGTSVVPVSVELHDLQPGGTYYYRVVAESSIARKLETFDGPGQAFTTPALPAAASETCPNAQLRAEQPYGLELPDCRAYEMVSPLDKNDANIFAASARASVSGEAVTYVSPGSFAEARGASGVSRYVSRREPGQDRWSTENISPLTALLGTNLATPFEQLLFTPDLSEGVEMSHYAPLAPGETAGRRNLVIADLASAPISYRAVAGGEPEVIGVSTDLSHVVFERLIGTGSHVYEWAGDKVSQIDLSPTGTEFQGVAEAGAPSLGFTDHAEEADTWHSVSANGLRAFFTVAEDPGSEIAVGQLYVRENPEQPQSPVAGGKCTVSSDACTVEVSASQKTNGSGPNGTDVHGPQPAFYRDAGAEGEQVFFTSRAELTNDANTGSDDNHANLYEYNLDTGALTDLTAENPEGAAVLGLVNAGENVGEENSYLYFVANGVLASNEDANGEKAQPGNCKEEGSDEVVEGERTCNLYVAHYGAGKWGTKFVATLDGGDGQSANDHSDSGDETDWQGFENGHGPDDGPGQHTARVTPNGTTLAFESVRSLTGYDNEQAEPGECEDSGSAPAGRCQEIYVYDAATGRLVCASCDPSGVLPVGPAEFHAERGEVLSSYSKYYLPRNLSENGRRVFFQTPDALVTHDSNGRQDVYEWEAEGEGSCAQAGGCVLPISDVAGDHVSSFMDASPNGDDVFIATSDQLVPSADTDTRVNAYDVRVDGGFPVTVAPPACDNGDSCKSPESPQPSIFGAPSSATFSGPGNPVSAGAPSVTNKTTATVVKCKRGSVKNRQGQCIRQKKSRTKKKAKKSTHGRGRK